MTLEELLLKKKPVILEKWFDLTIESYPPDTAKFIKAQKNRFANPVGHTISQGIEDLLNGLLNGSQSEQLCPYLDNVVRVRAVQNLTASQAINFIFLLKKVIRGELKNEIREGQLLSELLAFESKIDDLGLLAFDVYFKCREKIYEIRSTELRNRTYRLLKGANILHEIEPEEITLKDNQADNLTCMKRGNDK